MGSIGRGNAMESEADSINFFWYPFSLSNEDLVQPLDFNSQELTFQNENSPGMLYFMQDDLEENLGVQDLQNDPSCTSTHSKANTQHFNPDYIMGYQPCLEENGPEYSDLFMGDSGSPATNTFSGQSLVPQNVPSHDMSQTNGTPEQKEKRTYNREFDKDGYLERKKKKDKAEQEQMARERKNEKARSSNQRKKEELEQLRQQNPELIQKNIELVRHIQELSQKGSDLEQQNLELIKLYQEAIHQNQKLEQQKQELIQRVQEFEQFFSSNIFVN